MEEDCEMNSGRDSSSEGTKFDEEAIATGMMNLAIACIVVARQSNAKAHAARKLESRFFDFGFGLGFMYSCLYYILILFSFSITRNVCLACLDLGFTRILNICILAMLHA